MRKAVFSVLFKRKYKEFDRVQVSVVQRRALVESGMQSLSTTGLFRIFIHTIQIKLNKSNLISLRLVSLVA